MEYRQVSALGCTSQQYRKVITHMHDFHVFSKMRGTSCLVKTLSLVFYSCDISAKLISLLLGGGSKILFVASIIMVLRRHVSVYVEIFLSACRLVGWICLTHPFRRTQRCESCVVISRNESFNLSTAEDVHTFLDISYYTWLQERM